MERQAVVTGLGFISCIGNCATKVCESLRIGRHGFHTVEFFGEHGCPVKVAGHIEGFSFPSDNYLTWRAPEAYQLPREVLRGLPPHGLFVYAAIEQALADAGISHSELGDERMGLFCASAGSPRLMRRDLNHMLNCKGTRGNPMGVVSTVSGTLNFNFGAHFKIRGANCGFVSACASSAHALAYASDEIRLGRQDRILVAAGEDPTPETILPFHGMRALTTETDPDRASLPFDRRASGFVGSGGGVCLVLEEAALARERGAKPYARLAGWGQAGDGYNSMISHPEGDGLRRAMQMALASAGMQPEQVEHINAHATSTQTGDASEARAIRAVFPADGSGPVLSATKALTGHSLSMTGALEAAIACLCLREAFVPGNVHLSEPIAELDGFDLPRASQARPLRNVLSNSSGFGGANVSLLLTRS